MAKNYNANPLDTIFGISIAGFYATMLGIDACLILRELNVRHLCNKAFDTAREMSKENVPVHVAVSLSHKNKSKRNNTFSNSKNSIESFDDFVNGCK